MESDGAANSVAAGPGSHLEGVWSPSGGESELPSTPPLFEPSAGSPIPGGQAPPGPGSTGGPPSSVPPTGTGLRAAIIGAVVGAVIAILVGGGLVLLLDAGDTLDGLTDVASPAASPAGPSGEIDIRAVLAKAQPSVVSIETGGSTFRGEAEGAGSGVVLSSDGLVLTNAHVIAGAETIAVRLFDGTTYDATLVGSFPEDDVALIRLSDVSGLVPAELGSSAALQVGDDVLAIGNALNLGGVPSVTKGIVSALDRSIDASAPGLEGIALDNLIQTDTSINPGNSGGPLVNAAGQVVGINTAAILEGAENIGFAIAIDSLKPLIDELEAGGGAVTQDTVFLGVSSVDVVGLSPIERDEFGVSAVEGAFVDEVVGRSAAAAGGLEQGDVIVEIDGQSVGGSSDVAAVISGLTPGDEVEIVFERDGERQTTTTTLTTRADTEN